MSKRSKKNKKEVPQWKQDLLKRKEAGPPTVLKDPAPYSWSCRCEEECFCCIFGEWPTCYNCRCMPKYGMYFRKSHEPDKELYYCLKCFEKVPK